MQYSINYSHHTVHYIPKTYIFCNWKFVLFDSFNHFVHPPFPISVNCQAVLYIFELGKLSQSSILNLNSFLCVSIDISVSPN